MSSDRPNKALTQSNEHKQARRFGSQAVLIGKKSRGAIYLDFGNDNAFSSANETLEANSVRLIHEKSIRRAADGTTLARPVFLGVVTSLTRLSVILRLNARLYAVAARAE